ncbi:MAG: hypothetical protein AB7D36_05265 [Oscillospiraceae bacterium]
MRALAEAYGLQVGYGSDSRMVAITDSQTGNSSEPTSDATEQYSEIEGEYVIFNDKAYAVNCAFDTDELTLDTDGEKYYMNYSVSPWHNDFLSIIALADRRWTVKDSDNPFLAGEMLTIHSFYSKVEGYDREPSTGNFILLCSPEWYL